LTEPPSTGLPPEDRAPDAEATPPPLPPALGLTTFAIEGRRAPALFVVGWIGALAGVALIGMTLLGATGLAALVLSVAGFGAVSIGTILLAGSQTIERKAAGASYAGPSPLLVFVAVIATGRLAGYLVGIPLLQVAEAIPPALGDLLAAVILGVVFVGVLRLTVVGPGALDWTSMGLRGGVGRAARELLGGAAYAIPVILVTAVVAALAVQLAGVTPPSPLPPTGTAGGLLLHLLAGAVLAPFYEELLFRGFALRVWWSTHGPRTAILRSSLLFVLAHVLFVGGDSFREAVSLAVVGGIVRLPVAFVLGWLYVRTGSLWAPIGLHAAFNAVLITLGEIAIPQ
jgi:membrane protease YdiL (CAAX protease family)